MVVDRIPECIGTLRGFGQEWDLKLAQDLTLADFNTRYADVVTHEYLAHIQFNKVTQQWFAAVEVDHELVISSMWDDDLEQLDQRIQNEIRQCKEGK